MASRIVAHAATFPHSLPGVAIASRWSCDIYRGNACDLIAAGLMKAEQLLAQKGRVDGYTAFLPTGEPVAPKQRVCWREPGFTAIRQHDDGTVTIEITVPKDVQLARRKAERAAEFEAEQERINDEIVKNGHKYRDWVLKKDFGGIAETWEGTKAQLQAAGLGVGLRFPGEPGGPRELRCKCPLGFDFLVRVHSYDRARNAAGIYTAHSWYDRGEVHKQLIPHAPGVEREAWTPDGYNSSSDVYYGSAKALVAAGLVPDLTYFPGQPGRNKVQVTHTKDGSGQDWSGTIRKRGRSGLFCVEVPVSKADAHCRTLLRKEREEERKRNELRLSAERRALRQGADRTDKSDSVFRAERAKLVDVLINLIWSEVFVTSDGALSFDVPKDGELRDSLADAFQAIRDAVKEAEIARDEGIQTAAETRLKAVAARNDKGLQSILREAKGLRLVRSAPDEDAS